jgi:uncharacterized protein (TIGR03437 family)
MSIYGPGIGLSQPTWAVPVAGVVPSQLGGLQVFFDSLPAPILYAGPNQIDVVVPFAAPTSGTTSISVVHDGNSLGTVVQDAAPSNPHLFTVDGSGYGVVGLYSDGTPNSAARPAKNGDILTYYATGVGVMTPAVPDGTIPAVPFATPAAQMGMSYSTACDYIGDAPGQVEGVVQLNCRVQPISTNCGLCSNGLYIISDPKASSPSRNTMTYYK